MINKRGCRGAKKYFKSIQNKTAETIRGEKERLQRPCSLYFVLICNVFCAPILGSYSSSCFSFRCRITLNIIWNFISVLGFCLHFCKSTKWKWETSFWSWGFPFPQKYHYTCYATDFVVLVFKVGRSSGEFSVRIKAIDLFVRTWSILRRIGKTKMIIFVGNSTMKFLVFFFGENLNCLNGREQWSIAK